MRNSINHTNLHGKSLIPALAARLLRWLRSEGQVAPFASKQEAWLTATPILLWFAAVGILYMFALPMLAKVGVVLVWGAGTFVAVRFLSRYENRGKETVAEARA